MSRPTDDELFAECQRLGIKLHAMEAIKCSKCGWPCGGCVDRNTVIHELQLKQAEYVQAIFEMGKRYGELELRCAAWKSVAIDLGTEDGRMSRATTEFVLEGRVHRKLEGS